MIMKKDDIIPEFSLFGGPLQKLGIRLGLVREKTSSIRLGLALALLTWGVLMLLAFLQGFGPKLFSLAVIAIHVRFLVAIPLLFICETLVVTRMREFVRYIVRSDLVPENELPILASEIQRVRGIRDPWLLEVIFFIVAFAIPVIGLFVDLPGKTSGWVEIFVKPGAGLTWAQGWHLGFCLPLFRFLLLRWLWHLGLWWYFLWRVQKLNLRLIPTHSDGVGGLGYLEVVHEHFLPLALAISAVYSGHFAEDIASGAMPVEALYHFVPIVLFFTATLVIGPLFIFFHDLWICREKGLNEYMAMASRYARAFDRRWVRDEKATGESQLGTADMQSLADLTNSLNVVRGMRCVPVSRRLAMELVVCVVLPFLPLLLLKYPIDQLVMGLFNVLTGQ